MAELGDLFGSGGGASSEVKVQDEMMDFEYVRTCKDANLLKAILHRLQTGEDGHYPDLVKAVQKRILEVVPAKERARMERMTKTATIEEISQAERDILEWTSSITGRDSNLSKTSASKETFDSAPASQAPVRGEARVKNADPISKPNTSASISSDLLSSNSDKKRSQRISGYDFKAWEKFDADTVISSMDTQEENRKSDVRQAKETFQSESSSSAARRKQHHLNMMEKFRAESGWSALSDTSKALKADRERIKGNESFKAKEYENAFDCYSRSLALLELAPTYSNRAMTAIKLERYEVAIDDCSRALDIDPSFTKALIRRGMARTCIGQLGPAIEDFSAALERESGNLDLAKMLDKAKAKFEDVEGRPFGTPRVVPSSSTTPQEGRIVQLQSRPEEAFLRGYELVTSGKCNVAKTPLSEPSPPPAETFTRIQISQDEDSDEDEEEEEENAGAEDAEESLDERRLDAVSVPSSPAVGPFDQLIAEIDRLETAHSLGDALKLIESSLSDAAVSLSSAQREDLQRKQLSLLASLGRHKDVISLCNQVLDGDRTLLWAYIQRAEAHKAMGDLEGVRSNAEYILSKTISVEAQSLLSWLDAESNRLKEEGNLSAVISDYQEAYKLYTRSLVADPRNLKARNNRSQMLLKLSRFQECLDDTIEVLKAEGSNVKALFRCALAYEGLGRWSDALPQYELILKQEPDHATAQLSKQKLLEKIKAAKAPQKVFALDSVMSPPTLRKNVDEVKTTSTRKIDEAGKDSGNRELKKTKVGSSRARQTSLEAVLKTKEPELPKSPPSTVYELERVWRGCRGHPQLFAKYLAMFQKSTFKKVFKETISHDLISSIVQAVEVYILPDQEKALFILEGFAFMEKLKMTMALLPDEDVVRINRVITALEESNAVDSSRIHAVRRLFSI